MLARASSMAQVRTMPRMPALAAAVGLAEVADLAGGGADADDASALALLAQADGGGAGAGEGAAQVGGGDGVELLVGHLPQGGVAQDAGVVDQHVEPAELPDGPVDECLRRLAGAH